MNWIYFYTKWKLFFYRIQIYLCNFSRTVENQVNFAKYDLKWEKSRIFFLFSPNSSSFALYSFIIEIKVVRNVILNNIDLHNQPCRMHRSPSSSRQKFSNSKKSRKKINLIDKNISDLIIECFDGNKSCQKWYFKQFIFRWKTSYFAIFSLWEPPKFTKLIYLMIFKSDTIISNNTIHSFSWNKSC